MTRREILLSLLLASGLAVFQPGPGLRAFAKDGDSGGGDDRGGDDNSGHGSSNSGHGGDDHDDDDDDKDDDDDDRSGRGDHEDARDAVRNGRILPLKDVLRSVKRRHEGTVIGIDLRRSGNQDVYRVKLRDRKGAIRTLRINARTGKQLTFFGL